MMNEGRKYFQKQEKEVSNLYMSANGGEDLLLWEDKRDFPQIKEKKILLNGEKGEKGTQTKNIILGVVVIGVLIYAIKKFGFKPQID